MRDGLLPCCLTHKNWTPSKCSQKEIGKVFMQFLANLLASAVYKVSYCKQCGTFWEGPYHEAL